MRKIIIESYHYESDMILLNGKVLSMKNGKEIVHLSSNQMKLFICLTKRVHEKKEIIAMIWGSKEEKNKNEIKFNKLIYRTRLTLIKSGFPSDMILTIPHFGICINQSFLSTSPSHFDHII